jgi:ABC-type transporter Mla subunit MlaD
MLKEAQTASKQAVAAVEENTHHMEGFKHKIEGFAESMERALVRVGLAIGAWEAYEKFEAAEKTIRHLGASIEWNGGQVEHTLEDYERFAKGLSKTTEQSKGQILSLLNTANSFGLAGDAAKKAAKDAIYLAAATDNAPESMLRLAQAMATGDVEMAEMFKRMVPQLRGAKTEAEFAEKYTKLLGLGMKIAAGDVESAGGQLEKLKQQLGGVTKEIGAGLSTVISPLIEIMSKLINVFTLGNETARKYLVMFLLLVAAIPLLTTAYGYLIAAKTILITRFTMLVGGIQAAITWLSTYSLATNAATVATTALNAVMRASPWVLIPAMLGTAIAAVFKFKEEIKDAENQLGQKTTNSVTRYIEHVKGTVTQLPTDEKGLEYVKSEQNRLTDVIVNTAVNPKADDYLAQQAKVDLAFKAIQALKAYQKELTSPEMNQAAKSAVSEYTQKLRDQIATFGMTEAEVARYNLLKKGTNDKQREAIEGALAEADALAKTAQAQKDLADEQAAAAEKTKGHEDAITTLLNTLEEEVIALDATDEQLLKAKLGYHGASEEVIEYALSMREMIDAQKEQDSAFERAGEILKSLRTPQEVFNDTVTELDDLLSRGALSVDEYNLALDDAQKKLDEAGGSAKQTREEVQKLDAALSGSAEAMARVSAFREQLRGNGANFPAVIRSGGGFTGPQNVAGNPGPDRVSGPGADPHRDKIVLLLGAIDMKLGIIKDKPAVEFAAADF